MSSTHEVQSGWDVVVVGGLNSDFLIKGNRLPSIGETIDGDTIHEGPGGKGANQAVAVARLGGRVLMIGRVGNDLRGMSLIAALRSEGVNTSFIGRSDESATGAAVIMVDRDGHKQIMVAPGANRELSPLTLRGARDVIGNAKVILLQLEVDISTVAAAVELAVEARKIVVLDPAPAVPLPDDILRHISVIRSNAREAEVLTGIHVTDRDSARRAACWLLDRGVGAVTVQVGDAGNLLVIPGEEHFVPHLAVPSVDATGAGDAFSGALAWSLAQGQPISEAVTFANAAAAYATTVVGAQAGLPRRNDVEDLLVGASLLY
jgi:ribokinase